MGIRENLRDKPKAVAGIAGLFVLAAVGVVAATYWPEKKADLSKAFYSDDDGQTWFTDSAYLVPPFDHNGKTAVVAQIYSYDDGKKQFCAYVAQFNPQAKQQLDAALANAKKNGQPPQSVALYQDHGFMSRGQEVKLCGPNHPWIPYNDPKAQEIFTIHSPDGSAVDQCLVY